MEMKISGILSNSFIAIPQRQEIYISG